MAVTLTGIEGLREVLGQELGVSDWHEVTQGEINDFAKVTGDHQWIHVDPERAKDTPFGGTIAHGFYTVSLGPMFQGQVVEFAGFSFMMNYGLGKVRFPSPLPVGSNVRMRATISAVDDVAGGAQFTVTQTFEREGGDKPVCVAELLVRAFV